MQRVYRPLPNGVSTFVLGEATVRVTGQVEAAAGDGENAPRRVAVGFEVISGQVSSGSFGLTMRLPDWRRDDYLAMPAAVYAGNRFRSRLMRYPPMAIHPEDQGPDVATTISDVPRLSLGEGPSSVALLAGDLALPAFGVWHARTRRGLWLRGPATTAWGAPAYVAEEDDDRTGLRLCIFAPGVREDYRYHQTGILHPSDDTGRPLDVGDRLELHFRLLEFNCPDIPALFERLWDVRQDIAAGGRPVPDTVPLSAGFDLVEAKYQRDNWDDRFGYYRIGVGPRKVNFCYQAGWVGGLMNTLPLLKTGDDHVVGRVCDTFDFVFPDGQSASGFFHGMSDGERWTGDRLPPAHPPLREPEADHWHLTRKSADVLYFLFHHFAAFEALGHGGRVKPAWVDGTRRCADAFCTLWDRHGQFGQFVDTRDGGIIVGNSTAAGIAPGGLAYAADYFDQPRYLRVARAAAEDYLHRFVRRGYTTGGPGEILQNPDSESCFGLFESMIALHEVTGEARWLDLAAAVADQAQSWVVDYDFPFPPGSEFGRHGLHSRGAVFANTQNKHGAPGICTLSGVGLLKLYRATGKRRYLDLLLDIARALPQCVSRADRPIMSREGPALPEGWINERVNTSDWDSNVGGVFYASCWPEVSLMLTFTEVPGVYAEPDTGRIWCIDHVRAAWADDAERDALTLHNPTPFDARVTVLAESAAQRAQPLRWDPLAAAHHLSVAAGQSVSIRL